MATARTFAKYAPVEESDDEDLSLFVRKGASPDVSASNPEQSSGAAPAAFENLRRQIVTTSLTDSLQPFTKLSNILTDIKAALKIQYVALVVVSQNHLLQTQLVAPDEPHAPVIPQPATKTHPYAASRQREEIIQEDPDAILGAYSATESLPADLKELSEAQGLKEFLLQGVCDSRQRLKGMLVLGHPDKAPLNLTSWQLLSQTLEPILYAVLESSHIHRYVTFTESLTAFSKQSDMVIVLAKWLPYLLLGPWGGVGECCIATLNEDKSDLTLFKACDPSQGRKHEKLVSIDDINNKQKNMRTLSSTSRILRSATVADASNDAVNKVDQDLLIGHTNPLVESLRDLVPAELDESDNPLNSCKNMVCVYKRLAASGTLLERVVSSEVAVCIYDVYQHINERPHGHAELLFNITVGLPKSLLLLPIYQNTDDIVCGLYVVTHIKHDMLHVQQNAEIMLMIASDAICKVMCRPLTGENGNEPDNGGKTENDLASSNKDVSSLVTSTTGENKPMEHYTDEQNLSALQRVFAGIISDYSQYSEPPQVCEPEQIKISSVAGKGAFGVVYRGWIEGVNTISAIKVMSIDPKMDSMLLLRNATEMAAMSKINHPNIVQIIAYFSDCVMLHSRGHINGPFFRRTTAADKKPGSQYSKRRCCVLVMEYCAYGTLLHALNMDVFRHSEGTVDLPTVCSVLLELVSALDFIHRHGIIHCDLKPQNVLLKLDECNPRGFVTKLADFGLARVVSQSVPVLSGDSAGTPSHLAPEIVKVGDRKSMKTFKADVYAFGVLMWEMYMGQEAFGMVDKQAVLTHVVLQCKRLPFPPNADPAYVRLCQACWAADPNTRPTLDTVQAELRAIMRSLTRGNQDPLVKSSSRSQQGGSNSIRSARESSNRELRDSHRGESSRRGESHRPASQPAER